MCGVHPLEGTHLFTLSKGRGEFWRLRQKKVRGLPGNQLWVVQRPPGRGHIAGKTGHIRPFPGQNWTHPAKNWTHCPDPGGHLPARGSPPPPQSRRCTPRPQRRGQSCSLSSGEGWSLPRTRSGGEGSSEQPPPGYAKVSRGCPLPAPPLRFHPPRSQALNTSAEKLNTFGHIRAKTEHIQPESEHIRGKTEHMARIRVNTCRPAAHPHRRNPVGTPRVGA